MYWESHGNPNGIAVVVLHGGPGGGIESSILELFDLSKWNVVLFDQRGTGRSTPYCSLKNNTTDDLVKDIQKLRKHLRISKWVVCGGSWGTTLGLVYGEKFPKEVLGFILRGVCLMNRNAN